MLPIADSFEHDYQGCEIRYGRGRVAELGDALDERELGDALVVCGSNVGANEDLMDPIREGLGDRLAGVFDRTTRTSASRRRSICSIDGPRSAQTLSSRSAAGAASTSRGRRRSSMSTGGTSLTFARTLRSGRTRSATSHPGPTRAPRRRDSDDVRGRRRLDRRLTGGARRGRLAHRPADDGQRRGRDARDRPRGPGAVRDDPAVGAGGLGHERIQQGDRDAVRCRRFARERRDRGPRDAAPAGRAPARRRRPARRSGGDRPRRGRRAARPTRTEDLR